LGDVKPSVKAYLWLPRTTGQPPIVRGDAGGEVKAEPIFRQQEKLVKKVAIVAYATLCCALIASQPIQAQEWSAAQKEVWKNVEAYWALDTAGDLEGFMSYFHENYIGWDLNEPLPGDKATLRRWVEHTYKTDKTVLHDIKPVAINVFGNVAVVHYYYMFIVKGADGKESDRAGRWMDVLMKQGDKWVLIGDHGGRTSED
jgi:ketosteroid isomerase-like protein